MGEIDDITALRTLAEYEPDYRWLGGVADRLERLTAEVERKDAALRSIYMHDTTGETPYETVGKLSRIAFEAISAADKQCEHLGFTKCWICGWEPADKGRSD